MEAANSMAYETFTKHSIKYQIINYYYYRLVESAEVDWTLDWNFSLQILYLSKWKFGPRPHLSHVLNPK